MDPVKLSDIKMETVAPFDGKHSEKLMLAGEIPGAAVYHYFMPAGDKLEFAGQTDFIRIFFLCYGGVCFTADGKSFSYDKRAYFVAKPQSDIVITASADASLLEIRWTLYAEDLMDLAASTAEFPLTCAYEDVMQYRDFFKSETTISRAIIPQAVIPRFAMGTVEMKGDDLVGQHAHPLLDQFFFSFPENDMSLLIDCRICPMKGNTLLHIPLGSNHGVLALGGQRAHYLWIDCTSPEQKAAAVEYLNEVHKPTGVKETLN